MAQLDGGAGRGTALLRDPRRGLQERSSRCDDATFEDRLRRFQASAHPFVFIPGDNEWTDCHRENNGAYDPRSG